MVIIGFKFYHKRKYKGQHFFHIFVPISAVVRTNFPCVARVYEAQLSSIHSWELSWSISRVIMTLVGNVEDIQFWW